MLLFLLGHLLPLAIMHWVFVYSFVSILYMNLTCCIVTTRCVIEEGNALGPQLSGAVLIAKRFKLRKCAHHKVAVPAAECIMSMMVHVHYFCLNMNHGHCSINVKN